MKQLTYTLDDGFTLDDMINGILADSDYQHARSSLLLVLEPHYDEGHIRECLQKASAILPRTVIAGVTTMTSMGDDLRVPRQTVCSLLLFQDSSLKTTAFDFTDNPDAGKSGGNFAASLPADTKGILVLASSNGTIANEFVSAASHTVADMPLFGMLAGTAELGKSKSLAFCNGTILKDGLMAIAFSGRNLHISTHYDLGFRRLGRALTITAIDDLGYAAEVDGRPAVDTYRKYLGVPADEHFYRNVCEFPMLHYPKGSEHPVARIPMGVTEDGHLKFTLRAHVGDQAYLSYGRPSYLLSASYASSQSMMRFAPQAALIFACVNRRVFLGNRLADLEFNYFRASCDTLCFAYGDGEIFKLNHTGGILNSALVSVGFREGDAPEGTQKEQEVPFPDPTEKTDYVPLADRLVTFLEATSAELQDTIEQLDFLAHHDTLTGVLNRRGILGECDNAAGNPNSRNLALIMIDIDFFKQVNDAYGHKMGDEVLKKMIAIVKDALGPNAEIGRWGGEEFMCLLTDTPIEEAQALGERMRRSVECADFGKAGSITISIGITKIEPGESTDSAFSRVDKALYNSKEKGRNCISTL
ncbi:MAG: diguanylate cyclase domain-containing protein [Eggerthellaceae bacterium]